MEDQFKVKIPTDKISKLKTVKDLMDYLVGEIYEETTNLTTILL